MSIFLRLTVALALLATVAQAGARTLSFYGTPLNPIIKEGEGEGEWVAQASYSPASEHVSNFAQLTVSTSKLFQDDLQTFAAGYLEGLLTAESVHQHYDNMVCQVDCSGYVSPQLRDFFETQDAWARAQVSANAECPYWGHIGSLLAQADGLRAGYGASEEAVKRPLDAWAFTLINSLGDLFDIVPAVDSTQRPDFKSYSYPQLQSHMQRTGHCSALIKVTAGLEEVWVGHTSWFTYSAMLRIYKSYKFDLQNPSSQ
ncbi:phospholipase B-like protein, partial [Ochromonadaceae sp. CCMP2298]